MFYYYGYLTCNTNRWTSIHWIIYYWIIWMLFVLNTFMNNCNDASQITKWCDAKICNNGNLCQFSFALVLVFFTSQNFPKWQLQKMFAIMCRKSKYLPKKNSRLAGCINWQSQFIFNYFFPLLLQTIAGATFVFSELHRQQYIKQQ